MLDKRLSDASQDMPHDGDTLADQYIEQYLAYLDGERPAPPSTEGLSAKELAEVEGAIKILRVHRRSRTPERSASPARPTQPPDVVVSYHSADRGWANWITYELQHVGYRCRADAFDRADDSDLAARSHLVQVVTVVSAHSLASDANWPASAFPAAQATCDERRPIAVRVDDCEMPALAPSQWIDLTASTEHAARELLLQKVARGQPESRMVTARPRYRSPLELFLHRLGSEHETASRMLELCVRSGLEDDHLTHPAAQPPPATADLPQPTSTQPRLLCSPNSELVPPLMRTAVGNLLSCETRELVSEVAVEMLSLAEVKKKLRNIRGAQRAFDQALAIRAVAQELDRRSRPTLECQCDGGLGARQVVASR
jgi:TIR domain